MDIFQSVIEQEKEWRARHAVTEDQLERTIALGERVAALRGSPGYEAFEKALADLRVAVLRQLTETPGIDADRLFELRGQVQAYGQVLSLIRNTENNLNQLAEQLRLVQDERKRRMAPNGSVLPAGTFRR